MAIHPYAPADILSQRARIITRLHDLHDAHGCAVWERWTEEVRDSLTRQMFTATYDGCRTCGVKILDQ